MALPTATTEVTRGRPPAVGVADMVGAVDARTVATTNIATDRRTTSARLRAWVLSGGERLQVADDLQQLGLAQLLFPRRHRREGNALADPVEELARRVLRHMHLKVERFGVEGLSRRAVAETLRAVADDAARLIESPARRHGGGIVRRGVLGEPRGERYRRRRDVRSDRVADPERDHDEDPEETRALREPLPLAIAAPADQREQTEERRADGECDRDLL